MGRAERNERRRKEEEIACFFNADFWRLFDSFAKLSSYGKYPEFKGNVATIYTHPMAQGGSGNAHYGGKAEVYMDVGEAMGKAMVELLKAAK